MAQARAKETVLSLTSREEVTIAVGVYKLAVRISIGSDFFGLCIG